MTKRLIKDAYSENTPPKTRNRKPREAQKSAGCKTASNTHGSRFKKKRTDLENLERHGRMPDPISLDALTWSATD